MSLYKKIESYWFIGLLLLLMSGVFIRYLIDKKPFREMYSVKEYCLKEKKASFRGRVTKTYFDKNNKGAFVYYYKKNGNTKKRSIYLIVLHPESYIQKGDSIVKIKGESKYNIYKNSNPDSLITLEFDCSYWDK